MQKSNENRHVDMQQKDSIVKLVNSALLILMIESLSNMHTEWNYIYIYHQILSLSFIYNIMTLHTKNEDLILLSKRVNTLR